MLGIVALCGDWQEAIEFRGGEWYRNYRVETRPWYGGESGSGDTAVAADDSEYERKHDDFDEDPPPNDDWVHS